MSTRQSYITYFSECCQSKLTFLCEDYGFHLFIGQLEYSKGRKIIKPIKMDMAEDVSLYICRLEHADIALELTLDLSDMVLDCYISYDFINRFSLHDILRANKLYAGKIQVSQPISSLEFLDNYIEDIASAIHRKPELFTQNNPKKIDKALKMRSKRIENTIRQKHEEMLEQAISRAAKAYQEKDYRRVVEIFKPYEDFLKGSDKKKYEQAITFLTQ